MGGEGLNVGAWRSRIAAIATNLQAAELRAEPLEHRLEAALSQLWCAMQSPPDAVRSAYQIIKERDLVESRMRAAQLALKAAPAWAPDTTAGLNDLVRAVALEIRALDRALYECRDLGRFGDPNEEYRAYGGEDVFILPCIEGSRPSGRRGQDFDRRGLVYNRILPGSIDGLTVRLHQPVVRGPGMDGTAADLVSALFANVLPIIAPGADEDLFRVTGLTNEAALADDLRVQVAALDDGGAAMMAVWPELTMPPALQTILIEALQARALADDIKPIGFVVAGSWHETRGPGFVNRAGVLDDFGTPLLEVLKRGRYEIRPGVLENLDPGVELPILMYGDLLIAFGICKDFCERRAETPFARLDVDLVIVPSLGDQKTMGHHAVAADTLATRYGARVLVVQQFLSPDASLDVWGSVLRPADAPRRMPAAPVRQENFLDRTRISCTIP